MHALVMENEMEGEFRSLSFPSGTCVPAHSADVLKFNSIQFVLQDCHKAILVTKPPSLTGRNLEQNQASEGEPICFWPAVDKQ